jgi:hypothetical protein
MPKSNRTLQSGREVESQDKELRMSISSKCPAKWLFVDLETGDVWHHREGYKEGEHPFWREATAKEKRELKNLRIRR